MGRWCGRSGGLSGECAKGLLRIAVQEAKALFAKVAVDFGGEMKGGGHQKATQRKTRTDGCFIFEGNIVPQTARRQWLRGQTLPDHDRDHEGQWRRPARGGKSHNGSRLDPALFSATRHVNKPTSRTETRSLALFHPSMADSKQGAYGTRASDTDFRRKWDKEEYAERARQKDDEERLRMQENDERMKQGTTVIFALCVAKGYHINSLGSIDCQARSLSRGRGRTSRSPPSS